MVTPIFASKYSEQNFFLVNSEAISVFFDLSAHRAQVAPPIRDFIRECELKKTKTPNERINESSHDGCAHALYILVHILAVICETAT